MNCPKKNVQLKMIAADGKMYQDELFTRKLITKIRNGTLN